MHSQVKVRCCVYRHGAYYVETDISFPWLPGADYQQGGILLAAYNAMQPDMENFIRLSVMYDNGNLVVYGRYEADGIVQDEQSAPIALSGNQKITLRINRYGDQYLLQYSFNPRADGKHYTDLMGFTVPFPVSYAGLYAINGSASAPSIPVDFARIMVGFHPPIPSLPAIRSLLLH